METYTVLVFWGMWLALLFVFLGVIIDEVVKRQHGRSPDGDPDRDDLMGERDDMDRYDPEEVIDGLQNLRMALARCEKEYIDYACECVRKVAEREQDDSTERS